MWAVGRKEFAGPWKVTFADPAGRGEVVGLVVYLTVMVLGTAAFTIWHWRGRRAR
jgi:hypothetical protein